VFLTQPPLFSFGNRRNVTTFRPLLSNEKIQGDDLVEDLASGKRVKITGSFYGFLKGQRADAARSLPDVFDIVRQ